MRDLDLRWLDRETAGRPVALFLDFDGTISPHRPDGQRSVAAGPLREVLAALAGRADTRLAVVSGRPIRDLKPRVGVKQVVYCGNHGLEMRGGGQAFLHPLSAVVTASIRAALRLIKDRLGNLSKLALDDNGLSMSVNVGLLEPARRSAVRKALEELRRELAWLRLRCEEGYLGWDVIPDVQWDKGSAVARILKSWKGALPIAVGDGAADEAMFQAVEPGGIAIRVGPAGGSRARFRVDSPRDVEAALATLADR